jgi:hypothetical protein
MIGIKEEDSQRSQRIRVSRVNPTGTKILDTSAMVAERCSPEW